MSSDEKSYVILGGRVRNNYKIPVRLRYSSLSFNGTFLNLLQLNDEKAGRKVGRKAPLFYRENWIFQLMQYAGLIYSVIVLIFVSNVLLQGSFPFGLTFIEVSCALLWGGMIYNIFFLLLPNRISDFGMKYIVPLVNFTVFFMFTCVLIVIANQKNLTGMLFMESFLFSVICLLGSMSLGAINWIDDRGREYKKLIRERRKWEFDKFFKNL